MHRIMPCLLLLALVAGCSVTGGPSGTSSEGLAEAWDLYEQGLFAEAELAFQDLVDSNVAEDEANCGKGWSLLHQLKASQADRAFDRSLAGNPDWHDSRAGRAFANREVNSNDPLTDARHCLAQDPDWEFPHNRDINRDDLHVLMAQEFFYDQLFDSSLAHCQAVDGSVVLSATDSLSWGSASSFQAALFQVLARLSEEVAD